MAAALSYLYSPQFFINRARLAQRILLVSGSTYDEVRNFSFLFERLLAAQPGARFRLGDAVAVHGARDLLLHGTGHHDQAIEALVAAVFNQDGAFDNGDALRLQAREFGHHLFFPLDDGRMDQGVEARERLGIAKHAGCEPPAIDSPVDYNISAKLPHHG